MRLMAHALMALGVGICTASCNTDTVTGIEQEAAECAEIVDGHWVGELEGDTLSARLSYVGTLGCRQGGSGALNSVDIDWSWRGFGGNDHNNSGRFIYRPDSPDPDSLSIRLFDNASGPHCLNPSLENRFEAYFPESNRLRGTVTLWLGELDSTGVCSDPPLVDLRDAPVELVRQGDG